MVTRMKTMIIMSLQTHAIQRRVRNDITYDYERDAKKKKKTDNAVIICGYFSDVIISSTSMLLTIRSLQAWNLLRFKF